MKKLKFKGVIPRKKLSVLAIPDTKNILGSFKGKRFDIDLVIGGVKSAFKNCKFITRRGDRYYMKVVQIPDKIIYKDKNGKVERVSFPAMGRDLEKYLDEEK